MKSKIIFIGEYLLSFPGGAEKSIFEELRELSKEHNIKAYTFDNLCPIGEKNKEGINCKNFGLKYDLKFSRFLKLEKNKKFIHSRLKRILPELKKADYIITQGIIAPTIAKFCIRNKIKYHYYIRDELQLNIFENYEIWIRKILKKIKNIIEYSSIKKYKIKNKIALKNANQIIANSKFIANLLKKRYNLESIVNLPKINEDKYKKIKINSNEQKYIGFIGGGNAMKGYKIIEKISKELPNENFLIIGNYNQKRKIKNITYIPWQKDIIEFYKKCKLILIPSICNEAYGRVVIESNLLNIPAISSNKGGLKEANLNKDNIINDLNNIQLWKEKILKNLK